MSIQAEQLTFGPHEASNSGVEIGATQKIVNNFKSPWSLNLDDQAHKNTNRSAYHGAFEPTQMIKPTQKIQIGKDLTEITDQNVSSVR